GVGAVTTLPVALTFPAGLTTAEIPLGKPVTALLERVAVAPFIAMPLPCEPADAAETLVNVFALTVKLPVGVETSSAWNELMFPRRAPLTLDDLMLNDTASTDATGVSVATSIETLTLES